MSDLDKVCREAVQRHRARRLGLYFEAIIADYIQHHGISETRRVIRWWDDHLAKFDGGQTHEHPC